MCLNKLFEVFDMYSIDECVVSVGYWNKEGVGVVVNKGLEKTEYVAAIAEYCRLLEIKNGDAEYVHSLGRLYSVTSNFLDYMGEKEFCDVAFIEDFYVETEYTIYEMYIEPLSAFGDNSLIRIVADEFLLGVIDEAQPEANRLGMDFIKEHMRTNEEYDAYESENFHF